MSHNLVLTCRALPRLEDDARLVSMVQNLDKRYTGEDYSATKTAGRVLPTEVEGLRVSVMELSRPALLSSLISALFSWRILSMKGFSQAYILISLMELISSDILATLLSITPTNFSR